MRRLLRKAESAGVKGIIHGLKGKPGNRAMSADLKDQVLEIWQQKYRSARLNFSHFTEKLNEVEGVKIGHESVRRILHAKGVSEASARALQIFAKLSSVGFAFGSINLNIARLEIPAFL